MRLQEPNVFYFTITATNYNEKYLQQRNVSTNILRIEQIITLNIILRIVLSGWMINWIRGSVVKHGCKIHNYHEYITDLQEY